VPSSSADGHRPGTMGTATWVYPLMRALAAAHVDGSSTPWHLVDRALMTWTSNCAGKLDMSKQAIRLQQDGGSLQLRCTRGLNRGDVLLTVPDSLWITAQTVAKSRMGPMVEHLAPWLRVTKLNASSPCSCALL
jgi:hypothetical protein